MLTLWLLLDALTQVSVKVLEKLGRMIKKECSKLKIVTKVGAKTKL